MSGDQGQFLFDPDGPAAAPVRLPGGEVIIREIRCKSLLNQCAIGDYSFNCYVGCAHGCGYCYARFMQRFHPHVEEWGGFVDVRINAVDTLRRQLRRVKPGSVFTCSACDGWQPVEEHYRLTRECCRLLLQAGFSLNILTKNRLVLRDLDIFAGQNLSLGVTITTPDVRAVAAGHQRYGSGARDPVLAGCRGWRRSNLDRHPECTSARVAERSADSPKALSRTLRAVSRRHVRFG